MAQVNTYFYAEIDIGGEIVKIGSRNDPVTMSFSNYPSIHVKKAKLAAAGQLIEISATGDITEADLIFVHTDTAGTLSWEGTTDANDTSAVKLAANTWTPIYSPITTLITTSTDAETRGAESDDYIKKIWFVPDAGTAKVTLIAVSDIA